MTFRRGQYVIAIALGVINLGGAIYAFLTGEPMHAFVHGTFLVGSAVWLRYLNDHRETTKRIDNDEVQMLQGDISDLQRELHETQQRLDFADQLLREQKNKQQGDPEL